MISYATKQQWGAQSQTGYIQHLLGEKHTVLILTKHMYFIEVRAASYVHKEYVVNKGG
ncbi:hypothetical protein K402DRAFT_399108 [Aulographum hederae CBS 113979]|uniref:Uncharacterized protein n=1 Tax=Aulographum hederae CBS 113979 TaxID=1176131 RepID=A0A6G1GIS0_9PEZI|nr:hypothetical protein K402DRAFT_399108 [Aulographum hederae CBS 113979]